MNELASSHGLLVLDPQTEAFCDEQAEAMKLRAARMFGDALDIGSRLQAVQGKRDRDFEAWVEHKTRLSLRTARSLMAAAKVFVADSRATVARDIATIDLSAMYALSAPDVPAAARDEAIDRAEAGEHITKQEAEDMVKRAKADERASLEEKLRAALSTYQEDEKKRTKAAIREATKELRDDKKKLAERIKEIKAKAADPDALSKVLCNAIGISKFTAQHWQLLAQILGQGIAVGNKTYAPVSPEKQREDEQNLRLAATVTEAVQALAAAPPAEALLAACYPVQRALMREKLDGISAWIEQCRAALGTYADERV